MAREGLDLKAIRARGRRRLDQRGVALVMVLGAITVLTVFLTELQEETSSELSAALSERDALRAEYYARSAVNLSRLLIASEPEIRKSVAPMLAIVGMKPPQIPVWEFTDMVLGPFNDATGAQAFASMIGGDVTTAKNLGLSGGGHFEITIVDEDSKVNVNIAARNEATSRDRLGDQILGLMAPQTYNSLFEGRDGDNQFSDRQTMCGALVDWADSDAQGNELQYPCDPRSPNAANAGPEDNFYQVIGLGYRRKNAAYDSLEELRLVRGVGDDFWGTFIDPEPNNPKKRIMTVWGQGTINVNSANAQTLLAITCGGAPESELCNDAAQLEAFIMGVTLGKNLTMGLPLFSNTGDFVKTMKGQGMLGPVLAALGVKPVTFRNEKDVKKQIGVNSKMFSIYADGVIPAGMKRTTRVRIHAVVDFRVAAPIGDPTLGFCGAGAAQQQQAAPLPQIGQTPGQQGSAGARNNASASQAPVDAILEALNTNPAGTVVYWRVE